MTATTKARLKMKWIKHDTDANQDARLQNVLLDYGLEGYGLYWYCIELIAGRVDVDNITFELEHDARIIARNTGSTVQKVEEMMRYFVEKGLFEDQEGTITCLKLAKRLDKSMTSNAKMRELIDKVKENHDGVMTIPDKVMQEEKRREEIREEEINKPKKRKSWLDKIREITPSPFDNVDDDLLREWIKHKKKLSDRIVNSMIKELNICDQNNISAVKAIEWQLEKGYAGFEADWIIRQLGGQVSTANQAQSSAGWSQGIEDQFCPQGGKR